MPEPDYITIIPASIAARFNVVVMRYRDSDGGEYFVYKVSAAVTRQSAEEIAKLWAFERGGLEIR